MKLTRTLAKAAATAAAAVALLAPGLAGVAAPANAQLPAPITPSHNAGDLLRQQGCKQHYLIAVPGGANTVAGVPTFLPHGGQVFSTGLLTQAASAGEIQPLWVSYNSAAFLTRPYAAASAEAYGKTRGTVEKLANACPNATFSLTGYSLGADVAARLTHDIAYGTGPIAPERLDSVALIANPYQGGNGAVLGPGTSQDSRGALGSLDGGYGELSGKVLEICRPDDIVCSTQEEFRPLVGPALRTTAAQNRVPVMDFVQVFSQLGANSPKVIAGMGAHGQYGQAAPRAAAEWIVAHTADR
ncbi:cutinase family protein [Corynebacterium sp. CNCTC7651]|uniref:cutinase family protein n=1 Tax=Corynebacterium sp. CNCTC7651 TaxID=2815361 RepID=UPI001F2C1933|nr:cutinase family protein [Corynebacterium sp. CNCTC7651]UIZ92215.1 cutinase family protein [Corynebacterium sp. CNCTC7651]